ncbi:MAG: S1 RNA-binding domain-containing protein [Cyanobium sp.]
MAGSGKPTPTSPGAAPSGRPVPPGTPRPQPSPPQRRPPQVLMIKKDEPRSEGQTQHPASEQPAPLQAPTPSNPAGAAQAPTPQSPPAPPARSDAELFDLGDMAGLTMADLLGPDRAGSGGRRSAKGAGRAPQSGSQALPEAESAPVVTRSVDDFDFDADAFLAALEEQDFVGTTGEVVTGTVIGLESDGLYVDIGGKAPGFMPKKEAALGVITNLKERFPKGTEVEVLVTREQNADGMVTVSARALALRHSWEKVRVLEKEGKVVQVRVNGFNRGGVTCDLEGLRGFIPRSQLEEGENHEALVGRSLAVAFLEVNPETRKLVLSEKRAASAARFAELEVGQLVEGQVVAVKPYGFFVDLGGVSGLLHHSCVTGGALRDLREAFQQGDRLAALITELDPGRGRIALNTALLENQPGELLIARDTVMAEAADRANRARSVLRTQEQAAG